MLTPGGPAGLCFLIVHSPRRLGRRVLKIVGLPLCVCMAWLWRSPTVHLLGVRKNDHTDRARRIRRLLKPPAHDPTRFDHVVGEAGQDMAELDKQLQVLSFAAIDAQLLYAAPSHLVCTISVYRQYNHGQEG
jgi:hypothetical protein